MPLVIALVALILIAVAWNNTQSDLASNLSTDAKGFGKWFAALALVGALQWIPGFEKPARWLIGLVLLVLVLKNYTNIFAGFQNIASSAGTASSGPVSPARIGLLGSVS